MPSIKSFSIFEPDEIKLVVGPIEKGSEQADIKRVGQAVASEKENKKKPKIYRGLMSEEIRPKLAKALRQYQYLGITDMKGFIESLPEASALTDSDKFILFSLEKCMHLYNSIGRSQLKAYLAINAHHLKDIKDIEADSKIVNKVITLPDYIESLLSIFRICRQYDSRESGKYKRRGKDKDKGKYIDKKNR